MDSNPQTLNNVYAIDQDKGAVLGRVHYVYVDTDKARLDGVSLVGDRKQPEMFVPRAVIDRIGRDVVLVKAAAQLTPLEEAEPGGMVMNDLIGKPVVTDDGTAISELRAFEMDPKGGYIDRLHFDDGGNLAVDAGDVTIGDDVIVLPRTYRDKVEHPEKEPGVFSLLFGRESRELYKQGLHDMGSDIRQAAAMVKDKAGYATDATKGKVEGAADSAVDKLASAADKVGDKVGNDA